MTITNVDTHRRHAGSFLSGVGHRFARYRTYRRTIDELEHLTDRELVDLGISRAQIRSIAYKAAYEG